MGMTQTLEVLNGMVSDGIITRYAIGGAVATYNYIEATVTEDLDILVSFEGSGRQRGSGLIVLTPILNYLAARGYTEFKMEGIEVEGWPVQFLPVADDLDAEALAGALALSLSIAPTDEPVGTFVLRPEHIVATALKVGRPKDRIRILQFLEQDAVDLPSLASVLDRHDLRERWRAFCKASGLADPYGGGSR